MFVLLTFMFACGASEPTTDVSSTKAPSTPPAAAAVDQAHIAEVLKVADAADGNEDKVAHKCSGCALAMDGKAEHALEVEGTTLHFCSGMCKDNFSKDITGNLLKLVN